MQIIITVKHHSEIQKEIANFLRHAADRELAFSDAVHTRKRDLEKANHSAQTINQLANYIEEMKIEII